MNEIKMSRAAMLADESGGLSKYPHIIPPLGFSPIDRNGFLALPGAAGTDLVLETIPAISPGYGGWIRLIGLTSTDFPNSFFTIRMGGAPLRDYTRVGTNIGSTDTPRECFIELKPNYDLQLLVSYTAAAVGVRWTLFGWSYQVGR